MNLSGSSRSIGIALVGVLAVTAWAGGSERVGASPVTTSVAGAQQPHHGAKHCPHIFTKAFVAQLHRRFPDQRVTASIQDVRDGCEFSLHRRLRITTASVVKAQVLGAVLLKAQSEHRGLDQWERHNIFPMIRWSFNEPYVSDLYDDVGGVAGMNRFDRRMHAFHTVNTLEYGATVTTAGDRTNIVRRMLYGGGPMRSAYRKIAWRYMSDVTPTQRWGITAGMRRGWHVALKNGFYPISDQGWRVGSTGFLRAPHTHQGYAITIMTDRDHTQVDGIRLVERVARRAAAVLVGGPTAKRVVDRARCRTVRGATSWPSVARRLGTKDWHGVRRVSGGNPDPLFGQRVCSPYLRQPSG